MRKKTTKTVMHSYPGMVALVTAHWKGQNNIMAAGWHSYISYEPPIYGVAIAEQRHTHHMIKESGEFAINFLPAEKAEWIQQSGVFSGADTNKLEAFGIPYESGEKVQAPILKDAYVAYECKVRDIQTYGDHDWFVGDMVLFYRDDFKFQENGLPDWEQLSIPLYVGRSNYLVVDHRVARKDFFIQK